MEIEISRTPVHHDGATYRSVSYISNERWGSLVIDLRPEEVTGDIVWIKDTVTDQRRCEYRPAE